MHIVTFATRNSNHRWNLSVTGISHDIGLHVKLVVFTSKVFMPFAPDRFRTGWCLILKLKFIYFDIFLLHLNRNFCGS